MKDKIVIVNLSPHIDNKFIHMIKKEMRSGNELLIIIKSFDSRSLRELVKPFQVRNIEDFIAEDDYKVIDFQIKDFVEKLPSMEGNSRFKEIVSYKGHSLWQVIEHALFWLFLPIGQYKLITENIIRLEKPAKIVIFGVKSPVIFWRNVEMGLSDRKLLRKIASFINNSRTGSTEGEVMCQVARSYGVDVIVVTGAGILGIARYHLFSALLPSMLNSYLWYSRFKRDVLGKKQAVLRWSKTQSARNKTVAFIQTRNVAVAAIPVVQELTKNVRNDVAVIRAESPASSVVKSILDSKGIPYINYESYVTPVLQKEIKQGSVLLRSGWRKLQADTGFINTLKYEGISLWPAMKDLYHSIFTVLLPEAVRNIEIARQIMETEKPACLILMDDMSPLERAAGIVAKSKKIPSIMVHSGAFGKKEPPIQQVADKVCVWGEMMRDLALKRKGDLDTFVITGNPGFDYQLNKLRELDKSPLYEDICLKSDKDVVIFTSGAASSVVKDTFSPERREADISAIYRAIKQLPGLQFVTKLHPAETPELHLRLIKDLKLDNVKVVKFISVYYLLSISELLITFESTTAVEAMLLERPVITINMSGQPDVMPFASSGATIGVYKEEEIVPTIKAALCDENIRNSLAERRKEFIYKYAYLQDGKAASRVAELVMQLCEKHRGEVSAG